MENAPGKENTFPRLYAGSGRVPEDTARRVVFASWALLEPTEGHTDAPAAAAVREELMRCIARGEPPVLCLYAGEDPAWFAAKGGWLAEDNLRCFLRYAGQITASRKEQTAYHLSGTPEPDGFLDLTTLMLPVDAVKAKAKEFGVSVTEFIAAVMMKAISDLQTEKVPRRMRRRPVKVLLPVNLRGLFPSRTLRNFASYVTPEIDPRLGDYSLAEICKIVHYRMGLENDARMMAAKIATNVASERSAVLRAMPLFIKNIAMKAVFDLVGECKSCLCLSNLGLVQLPDAMAPYVARMDFIIGVQAKAPHNCGVVSWDGTMYINMIRNIREPELESHFYRVLHTLGLPVKVESNQRWT